jgi:hypothetical protein
MMDFCLKVGTEIETLFRIFLEDKKFDLIPNIKSKRENQNIDIYRKIIEPKYQFSSYELYVHTIKKKIIPFEKFDIENPEWFKLYSRYKHDKIKLLEFWNLKHCLYSLGCLFLLVINHPSNDKEVFILENVGYKIFNLLSSVPKFCFGVLNTNGSRINKKDYTKRVQLYGKFNKS